jgi:hypothetical protein
VEERLRAAEIEVAHLRAQLAEMKIQRDAINDELAVEREHRFQLLTLRQNWLHFVVRIANFFGISVEKKT